MTTCPITPGETRLLHGYPATVLTECEPAPLDQTGHQVRFDTPAYRATCAPVETSAFCWEFGPVVASSVHN